LPGNESGPRLPGASRLQLLMFFFGPGLSGRSAHWRAQVAVAATS
jgi:hypothetical protein